MNKKKKKNAGIGKKTALVWGMFLILFFFEIFFYTWCRVQCVKIGYEVDNEKIRYQKMLKEQSNLKIELARLKSPERIAWYARTKLGLTMPRPDQTIVVP